MIFPPIVPASTPARPSAIDLVLPVVGLAMPLTAFFASKGTVILLGLIALAGLADLVRGQGRTWPFGRLVPALVGLLLLWSGLSAAWEFTPGLALPKTLQLLGLAAGGATAFIGLGNASPRAVRWAALGLLTGMALGLLAAVIERTTSCGLTDWSNALRGKPPVDFCMMFRFKIGVTVSAFLAMPLTLWLWARGARIVPLLLGVLVAAGAVSAGSQTAAVSAVTGLAAFAAFHRWRRGPMAILAAFVVATIAFAPQVTSHLPDSRQVIEAWHRFPSSLAHRLTIWAFANRHIAEKPVLGWGTDASRAIPGGDEDGDVYSYHEATNRILIAREPQLPLHPHNNGLQVWLELGGVGAILYTALLLGLMVHLSRIQPQCRRGAALAILSMALITGLASFGIWQSWWLATLWLTAGFTRVLTRREPCAE